MCQARPRHVMVIFQEETFSHISPQDNVQTMEYQV
jgi:hypothetical protein